MNVLDIVGRTRPLLQEDLSRLGPELDEAVKSSSFLVIGGAGSIGQEVVKQIFKRSPRCLHVVDISENNMAELVRDLRSSLGYISGETEFFPIDMNSREFQIFWQQGGNYDYVLNLAALKHVRTEKHAHSLMRMILTNVVGTDTTLQLAGDGDVKKYFAVSSDKAKNPANLMGATKTIMEDVLFTNPYGVTTSTARFANVAFSDGSLLHGFRQRLVKGQPLSAPDDIERYFIVPEEAGQLCILSAILGNDREIFFPQQGGELQLTGFPRIARAFLESNGYEAIEMDTEEEARARVDELSARKQWPCYFFASDTSGEKPFEEFYSEEDSVDWDRMKDVGIIRWLETQTNVAARARSFLDDYTKLRQSDDWDRADIVKLISRACPTLGYTDTGKFLDSKM